MKPAKNLRAKDQRHLSQLPIELDHDLQSCVICLKTFLPQAYERRLDKMQEAKSEGKILAPKLALKRRGEGKMV